MQKVGAEGRLIIFTAGKLCLTTCIQAFSSSSSSSSLGTMMSGGRATTRATPKAIVIIGGGGILQGTFIAYQLSQKIQKNANQDATTTSTTTIQILEAKAPASAASGKGGEFMPDPGVMADDPLKASTIYRLISTRVLGHHA